MSDQDRSDVDAQFAEIIAHWAEDDALASAGAGPWPEQEGYGPPAADHAPTPDTTVDAGTDAGRALLGALPGRTGSAPARGALAARSRGPLHPGPHGTAARGRPAVLGHPHRPHRWPAAPALP